MCHEVIEKTFPQKLPKMVLKLHIFVKNSQMFMPCLIKLLSAEK